VPNYTTEAAVRHIIELDDGLNVDLHISDAHLLITELIGDALTVERLEAVERWLTAHMLASGIAPRTASESVKGLSESFQYQLGSGLETTMYGSMAMRLDTSGKLATWNKQTQDGGAGVRPKAHWLGTVPGEA
jgi:hypothetical protein